MYDPLINILIAAGVVALLGNLLLSAYALHKVRRVHIMSFRIRNEIERIDASGQMFWQLQALDGLYRDLKFASALPLTRGWAASPDFLSVLARHAMDRRPEVVVECGSGVSTVVLARCMQLNGRGRVIALDHDSVFAEETRRNLARHGLSEWAEIIDAPLQKQFRGAEEWNWYDMRDFPDVRIDMLVVDGPPMPMGHMVRYPAGPELFPRLSSTATVFLDDAEREDERRIVERWIAENPGLRAEKIKCEKGCVMFKSGLTCRGSDSAETRGGSRT